MQRLVSIASAALLISSGLARAEWSVENTVSSLDDSAIITASASANEPFHDKFGRSYTMSAVVICRGGKTDFYLHFGGEFVADSGGFGSVKLRTDSDKAVSFDMDASTDNSALGLWRGTGTRFLKTMIGKKSLLVVAIPYNESPIESRISLDGFDQSIAKIRAKCKW